ncbi:MAG TPA: hypothetical protein VHU15_02265 [Stellaceae bacterium]|jgi:hypothetical protein|nr:hypothetical protein [Stellaceae bacterium]
MLSLAILESVLSSLSTLFGGLGVFCVFRSFEVPRLGLQALLLLGVATAIVLTEKQSKTK